VQNFHFHLIIKRIQSMGGRSRPLLSLNPPPFVGIATSCSSTVRRDQWVAAWQWRIHHQNPARGQTGDLMGDGCRPTSTNKVQGQSSDGVWELCPRNWKRKGLCPRWIRHWRCKRFSLLCPSMSAHGQNCSRKRQLHAVGNYG